MINTKDYQTLKEKEAVTITKTNNVCSAIFKKYDENTGEALDDEVLLVGNEELLARKETLESQIAVLQAEIDEIDVILADCDKVENVVEEEPKEEEIIDEKDIV